MTRIPEQYDLRNVRDSKARRQLAKAIALLGNGTEILSITVHDGSREGRIDRYGNMGWLPPPKT